MSDGKSAAGRQSAQEDDVVSPAIGDQAVDGAAAAAAGETAQSRVGQPEERERLEEAEKKAAGCADPQEIAQAGESGRPITAASRATDDLAATTDDDSSGWSSRSMEGDDVMRPEEARAGDSVVRRLSFNTTGWSSLERTPTLSSEERPLSAVVPRSLHEFSVPIVASTVDRPLSSTPREGGGGGGAGAITPRRAQLSRIDALAMPIVRVATISPKVHWPSTLRVYGDSTVSCENLQLETPGDTYDRYGDNEITEITPSTLIYGDRTAPAGRLPTVQQQPAAAAADAPPPPPRRVDQAALVARLIMPFVRRADNARWRHLGEAGRR
ncbi:hypothetical protein PRIPAC_75358 [Pristionchus pacificus]|uniref:Uncharacterized protein n=1 Tax=Pristionchus pacificus TaxID=54126 RepID=A0A2A6C6U3_PRIPA|nr:hypothetical protein PRIPAC_75358 [Pristionchus pacificus]|eukprot:PDM73932.1 hypothetical protein PRIPAC_41288 [Pristionchus pacificus]